MSTLLSIPSGVCPPEWESAPWTPPSAAPAATGPLPWSKWWHHLPDWVGPPFPSEATSKVTPEEPPHNRDSRLMQKAREDYFQTNWPHFNNENSFNLTGVFQSMIEPTGLLGSEIFEIQETGMGQHELEYANYTLKTLPKGLKFFHPVSPLESPKVMGLTNIHHPDALCHFNGLTHCPWCRNCQSSADDALHIGPGV